MDALEVVLRGGLLHLNALFAGFVEGEVFEELFSDDAVAVAILAFPASILFYLEFGREMAVGAVGSVDVGVEGEGLVAVDGGVDGDGVFDAIEGVGVGDVEFEDFRTLFAPYVIGESPFLVEGAGSFREVAFGVGGDGRVVA